MRGVNHGASIVFATTNHQDQFFSTLPSWIHVANDYQDGCYPKPKADVHQYKHVQVNSTSHLHWLAFDIDHEFGAITWDFNNCPAPNLAIQNQKNGHAHLLYGLKTPVRTAADGRDKPIRYVNAIKDALSLKLGADLGFSGYLIKNPLNSNWRTLSFEQERYELRELHDYLDLKPNIRKSEELALGRNVTLFNDLRTWAYKQYRRNGYPTYDQWLPEVEMKAIELNTSFNNPLVYAEVKHVARSVSKYCVKNFSAQAFSEIQSKRGKRGGRPTINEQTINEVYRLHAEGYSLRETAREMGIGLSTVRRYLQNKA